MLVFYLEPNKGSFKRSIAIAKILDIIFVVLFFGEHHRVGLHNPLIYFLSHYLLNFESRTPRLGFHFSNLFSVFTRFRNLTRLATWDPNLEEKPVSACATPVVGRSPPYGAA